MVKDKKEVKMMIPEKIHATIIWERDTGELRLKVEEEIMPELLREVMIGAVKAVDEACKYKLMEKKKPAYVA